MIGTIAAIVFPTLFYITMIAVTARVVRRTYKWSNLTDAGEREVISVLWGFLWFLSLPAMLAIHAMRIPDARERETQRIRDAAAAKAAREKGLAQAERDLRDATSTMVELRPEQSAYWESTVDPRSRTRDRW